MLQSRVVQRHLEHEEKVKSKGEKNMQLIVWFQDEKKESIQCVF